jgi:hypothetical protein
MDKTPARLRTMCSIILLSTFMLEYRNQWMCHSMRDSIIAWLDALYLKENVLLRCKFWTYNEFILLTTWPVHLCFGTLIQ